MVSLTDHQWSAVKAVAAWFKGTSWSEYADKFTFGGYAGTGKSTVLPVIIESCGLDPYDVAFMAPTGKAAKVMTAKMRAMGMTAEAMTIHKSIYRPKALKADVLERQLADARFALSAFIGEGGGSQDEHNKLRGKIRQLEKDLDKAYDSSELNFQLNVDSNVRSKRLIVVDEASMVGESVADDLRSFGVPILAIGDPGQLPPVGDNPGLMIGNPDAMLTEIHRQAADNPIIWFATKLRNEEFPDFGTHGDTLRIIRARDDDVTFDLERNTTIIVGRNRTRWKITTKLRDLMGYGPTGPVEGEPLMIIKNSVLHPGLVNGTLAWCRDSVGELQAGDTAFQLKIVDEDDVPRSLRALQQPFEAHYLMDAVKGTADKTSIWKAKKTTDQVDWAYVLTAHKLQGSQADDVVVHDEMGVFRDDAWKWAYTAATRAAERLTWVV